MMLVLGLVGIRFFINVIRLPKAIMIPVILTFTVIGSYAINNSIFDVAMMCFLGFAGYLLRINNIPLAPVVLALILGPIGENALLQTLSITHGNPLLILTRPICIVLFAITLLSLFFSTRKKRIVE